MPATIETAAKALCETMGVPTAQAQKRDVCQWITRPKADADRPGQWTAKVAICGDVYDLEHCFASNDVCDDYPQPFFEIFDFKKQFVGGPHHVRVVLGPGDDEQKCDCQWATYKPAEEGHKQCRHVRALRALLAWLEEREQLEYARDEANRRLAELPDVCDMAA